MPHKDPEKNREYQWEWARKRRESRRKDGSRRDYSLRRKYGITEAQWWALFDKQGRRCAICKTDAPKSIVGWHTDHDHETGNVRGILCENCNRGLGMFAEDISFLRKAIAYLGITQGVFNGDTIERREILNPFHQRSVVRGKSFGKGSAGYDIRLDQDIVLKPKEFCLASSMEHFDIPTDCVGMVCDKSSYARQGLSLFNTVAEPGWRGYLTLELFNASNDVLEMNRGDPIAQVLFLALDKPTSQPYDGKYQNQERGPQEAREESP